LEDLDRNLKNINEKSGLLVIRGNPVEVLPALWKQWKIDILTFEIDTEPYAKMRDQKIIELALNNNIEVFRYHSHTLYDIDRFSRNGTLPLTYQAFLKVVSSLGKPKKAIDIPEQIPGFELSSADVEVDYSIPTLEEINVDPKLATTIHQGGESNALKNMNAYLKDENRVRKFSKPDTNPSEFDPPSTTLLSPHLKFGTLSVRLFYWKLHDIYTKSKEHTQPPVSLHGQILWREFFYSCGSHIRNFDKMKGSAIARQIPWRTDQKASEDFKKWATGQTGYPWIDAIMIQLEKDGWIHHLARHSVACFLTRGDLFIHWEWGMKEFEKKLLDADWSLNAGNWLWLSASAFFHQYYRVYSPVAFAKKWDPEGNYVKNFIPALKKMPSKYIYEPWKAPIEVQKQAGCIVGKDYPKPMCIHEEVSKINITKMKAAYSASNERSDADEPHQQEAASLPKAIKKRKL
jgi:cryptochrome